MLNNMDNEKLIDFLLKNNKGITPNEKLKIKEPFDSIYFEERIAEHQKKGTFQKRFQYILIFLSTLSIVLLFGSKWIDPEIMLWLKGLVIGTLIAVVVLLPNLLQNHQRTAFILKIIREIRQSEEENLSK